MMRFLMKFSAAAAIFAFLGGCAVGNTYDYQSTAMQLPVKGEGQELNVEVIDKRPYILNGKKAPSFIGLQRGGYGNPFDVNTSSGRPLSEEFRVAISRALENSSYDITDSADKTVELTVREWKTDAMMKLRLIYDLTLSILTSDDQVVASVTDAGRCDGRAALAPARHYSALCEPKLGRLSRYGSWQQRRPSASGSRRGGGRRRRLLVARCLCCPVCARQQPAGS